MHEENLKLLYNEYKACLRNQFSEYLGSDDRYTSYLDKCSAQINDIQNYYLTEFNKYFKIFSENDMYNEGNVDKDIHLFTRYGWDEKRIRNL